MLSLSEERGKGDTKAAEMMSLKSLFGHHAIPGDKGHCSISNGSQMKGLQPELFFKLSHEIYNYGEG
ncbi:hypothetical protein B296_00018027 [Ensete ventricosum]|uniref:Uncharacterized protein n=1 Tax=Ensete ventricosum TaxID=4639 RepID=A0A426ZPI3_ENSVE|nr:hypothetical protein B296_00018027 [Ensete ventricosum]